MFSSLSSFVWPAAQPADDGLPPAAAIKWNETLDGAYLRLHALHGKPTKSTVGEFTQAVAGTSANQWYGRSGFWKTYGLGDAPAEARLYAELADRPRVQKKGRGGTKRSRAVKETGGTKEDVAAGVNGDGDDERSSDESVMAAIKWNETLDGAYLRLHALHGKPTKSTVGEFTQAVAGTSANQWYGRSGFWKTYGLGDAPAEARLYAELADRPRVQKKGRGGTKRSRAVKEKGEDLMV